MDMIEKSKIKNQKSRIYSLLILIIIISIAAFFRLWQLDSIPPGLYPDEAINGNEALSNPGKIFYPENNGREGLFINLLRLSFNVFGPSIWAIRLVPAIIGILTVFGLYFLTKELFQASSSTFQIWRYIALLASFFLAVSFWHINFSRIAFRAILGPFILTFSFYFLFKGFRTKKIFNFIISGIIFGLGFYTYTPLRLAVLILPFVFGPYWFLDKKQNLQKKFLLSTLSFLLSTFIIALPLGLYFFWQPQYFVARAASISVFAQENPIGAFAESLMRHLAMFNFSGDFNWRHNFSGSPMLLWPIGILFLIGFFSAIKELFIKKKVHFHHKKGSLSTIRIGYLTLVSWFFIMLLPGILTFEGIPHALRVIGVVPVVYIFAAFGGWQVYHFFDKNLENPVRNTLSNRAGKKLLIFATILFLLSVGFVQFDKYFQKWAKLPETKNAFSYDFVAMGKYLNSLPPDIEKYVIVNLPGVPVPYPEGIPMPAQTIMFIENTAKIAQRAIYLLPRDLEKIIIEREAIILPIREDSDLFIKLGEKFPEGKLEKKEGFWIYRVNSKFKIQNALNCEAITRSEE